MPFDPHHPHFWPSPAQRLLLDAALLEGDASVEAWQRWEADNDLETADPASVFILPAVYKNLIRAGYPDQDVATLKGIYKYAWGKNSLTLSRLVKVVSMLRGSGIECLVVKGAALLVATYRDPGRRMMWDADILIRRDQLDLALSALRAEGWDCLRPPPNLRGFLRELHHTRPDHLPLDVHFRDFPAGCALNEMAGTWKRKVTVQWLETDLWVPHGSDLLLHSCVEGRRLDPQSVCRWVVDFHELALGIESEEDWLALGRRAVRMGVQLPFRHALEYMQREFGSPIPGEALGILSKGTDSAETRSWYHRNVSPRRRSTRPVKGNQRIRIHYHKYVASEELEGRRPRILGFLWYFWRHYCWRIPAVVGRRLRKSNPEVKQEV